VNPHNRVVAIDPPRSHPPRRWRCAFCGDVGTLAELDARPCAHVYPECAYCGLTPTCAPDCSGIAAAMGLAVGRWPKVDA